eukprot:IDg22508t1
MRIARQGCAPLLIKWAVSRALNSQPARITRALLHPLETENTLDDEPPFQLSMDALQQPPVGLRCLRVQ